MRLDDDMVGELVAGRYRLEEQIAVGGMGTVWRARDELLQRPVAVKMLNDSLTDDQAASERFRREALTAAAISHPNMANVFDYVEDKDRPGIVMELVESETLAQRIMRDERLPVDEAIHVAEGVLAALDAAHREGIVHRDIKPANILLTPAGDVKVTDFGIARSIGDSSLTSTGMVMGTAHYSSPEQVRGEYATPSTDIYAMGVVLYEMLTGRKPFEADTAVAVALARLSEDPVRPRELRPDIPRDVEAVVMRALQRDPAERYSTAEEMRMALLQTASAPLDRTTVFATGSHDETIAFTKASSTDGREPRVAHAVAEAIPPAWVGRRLLKVLLPLVLVAALVTLLVARASQPVEIAVPAFEGKTVSQARSLAAENDLTIRIERVDSDQAKDTVVAQSVDAGEIVHEGTPITLSVSDGTPKCCAVPRLTGMSEGEAKEALSKADLTLGRVTLVYTTSEKSGEVFDQDPNAGTYLDPGDKVDIRIAKEPEKDDDDDRGKGKGKGKGDD